MLAAEILAGRRIGIRIETATLLLFDLDTRELLRARPNPSPPGRSCGCVGYAQPGRHPAQPWSRWVQRLADNTGVICIRGQRVGLGRGYAHRTLTIAVSDTTLAIELLPIGHPRRNPVVWKPAETGRPSSLSALDGKRAQDWLFAAPEGGPLSESNWKRSVQWSAACASIGRKGLRPHDLRHTCASIWLGAGADPKVVQRVLGHASAAMTMDLYGHLIDQNLWDAQRGSGAPRGHTAHSRT